MSDDIIRYDVLTQEALRSVIRKVLHEVSVTGLPGEHHFYITFDTNYPGVKLSARMRERYPDNMTIVIQHTFWNLSATDNYFEVDLSFNDIRERLRIPFLAVQAFFDPAVKFGLQFDVDEVEISNTIEQIENLETNEAPHTPAQDAAKQTSKQTNKPKNKPASAKTGKADKADKDQTDKDDGDKTGDNDETQVAEIVSLDAFRKNK